MLKTQCALALVAAGLACAPAMAQNGLVIGVDDVNVPIQIYNDDDGAWEPLFSGIQAWGIAADNATCTLYIGAGSSLYSFRPGDAAPTLVGTFDYNGANVNFVGLAFNEGSLYGVRNISTEAVYQIDPTTAVATLLWAYPTSFDFGGLDFDAAGTLYGTSDSSTGDGRGLYIIDYTAQSTTFVVGYPAFAGQNNDVDGLAIGDGRAYFVIDEPGEIAVYNLTTMAFEAPIPNPWTTSEIFGAAAFAPCFLGGDECPADFDNSGDLTLADFVAFRNAYTAGDMSADFNNSGDLTLADFVAFRNAYTAGCP